MLDPSLKNLLVEVLTGSMKPEQINAVGALLFKDFDLHNLTGKASNITIGVRLGAQVLVDYAIFKKKSGELIKLLVETDNNTILGKMVVLEGMEHFLAQLMETGFVYDFSKRKVVPLKKDVSEMVNWGALKDGRSYDITVISIDIVGNSRLVRHYGNRVMEKVYSQFWIFLKKRIQSYDGRIWTWAGDGGLIAFTFKGHSGRGVACALEILRTMVLFNTRIRNPIDEDLEIRLGLNSGKMSFSMETGKIVSEVINLAAHLEKQSTNPGFISITQNTFNSLDSRLASLFESTGTFETIECYTTRMRHDFYQNQSVKEAVLT